MPNQPLASSPEQIALAAGGGPSNSDALTGISIGIGGVIHIIAGLATSDPKIVQGPASILAVEARHDAFFREVGLQLRPNPSPFDTRISGRRGLIECGCRREGLFTQLQWYWSTAMRRAV